MLIAQGEFMKSTLTVLLFLFTCAAQALEPMALFQKPLIMGASISSEYTKVQSPGKKASLNFTAADQITVFAQPGRRGVDILAAATDDIYAGKSVMIGFDLFFWDSTNKLPNASAGALWLLMHKLWVNHVTVILADVPAMHPENQPGAALMNQEIHAACAAQPACILLPLDAMFRGAAEKGYIEYKGQRYTLQDFLPDGLHLSEIGSQAMADMILETVAKAP